MLHAALAFAKVGIRSLAMITVILVIITTVTATMIAAVTVVPPIIPTVIIRPATARA
jgi:hypothetical protein